MFFKVLNQNCQSHTITVYKYCIHILVKVQYINNYG